MRVITQKRVLEKVAALIGSTESELQVSEKRRIRGFLETRLKTAWEFFPWPELMVTEQRQYHANYSAGTAYVAGNFVWFPEARRYFQAVTSTTGNAPATLSGGSYVDNVAYWRSAAEGYAANDYSGSTAYVAGDLVYYPATDKVYHCHTASTGNLPTDTSYWGEMVSFWRRVAQEQSGETPIGEVMDVRPSDPRVYPNARSVPYASENGYIYILDASIDRPWLEYRKTPVRLVGEVWDSGATYAAGDAVYFSTDTYVVLSATSAGESPATHPAKYEKQEIPLFLAEYISAGAAGDYLVTTDEEVNPALSASRVNELIQLEVDKAGAQINRITRISGPRSRRYT